MRGLMYHHFRSGRYGVPRILFQEHCQILSALRLRQDPRLAPLEVTFDDGWSDAFKAASDLEAAGLRGRFFITTSWVGKMGFITAEQVHALVARGHTVGIHGHTHRFLRGLGIRELNEELQAAIASLTSITGVRVEEASMPGGRYDEAALHVMGDLGIKRVWTSQPGHWGETFASLRRQGRDRIDRGHGADHLEKLSLGQGDLPRSLLYGIKAIPKIFLGDRLYHKMSIGEAAMKGPSGGA